MSLDAVLRAVEERVVPEGRYVPSYEQLRLVKMGEHRARLITPDGYIPLQFLDHGAYSDVYRVPEEGPVLAFEARGPHASAAGKQVTTQAHARLPDNPHLPDIARLGATADAEVYAMPFYSVPLQDQYERAYRDAKVLNDCLRPQHVQALLDDVAGLSGPERRQKNLGRQGAVVRCVQDSSVTPAVAEAIEALALEMSPKDNFEFPDNNLAVDRAGNLVLLDVVY